MVFLFAKGPEAPSDLRPNRAAGSGYWKATGADKPIEHRKPVGIKKALVFYTGKAPRGERNNWIMHEYRSPRKKNSLMVYTLFSLYFHIRGWGKIVIIFPKCRMPYWDGVPFLSMNWRPYKWAVDIEPNLDQRCD